MSSHELALVRPTVKLKDSFLEALLEFQKEKLPWMMHLSHAELNKDFETFIESELNKWVISKIDPPIQQSEYWASLKGVYVGRIAIRHGLNTDLLKMGGHIGYDTRPTFRGKGIASSMLKAALPIAKCLGLSEVLLTCNDDNLPSIRIIEKNGGKLKEKKLPNEDGPIKRYYWITL